MVVTFFAPLRTPLPYLSACLEKYGCIGPGATEKHKNDNNATLID